MLTVMPCFVDGFSGGLVQNRSAGGSEQASPFGASRPLPYATAKVA
jgi:hypothetical protein